MTYCPEVSSQIHAQYIIYIYECATLFLADNKQIVLAKIEVYGDNHSTSKMKSPHYFLDCLDKADWKSVENKLTIVMRMKETWTCLVGWLPHYRSMGFI